jgi:alpha-amylase
MKKTIHTLILLCLAILLAGCGRMQVKYLPETEGIPFIWDNASIYFLLTDRFLNDDPGNDVNFGRTGETAVLRGFKGGDLKGITRKIREGYFNELGINAIWFSPVMEQGHGIVDEGTGNTYGFHGYWAKDWTSLDPNYGTETDLKELVETAHSHGIRVIMDIVLNHTGPVTDKDPVWPADWVRTTPPCNFKSYEGTVRCTLVENLPDIKTESDEPVELPAFLLEKWKKEGRLERELAELDEFFSETGFPRAPRYYIMKWIIDLIRDYGIDGFRIDTAKHVEESVWNELWELAERAFALWKEEHPEQVLDDNDFYMMGEVYNYRISSAFAFDFGDTTVNYFDYGFSSLINFEFKEDAARSYEEIFSKYSGRLNGDLKDYGMVNYISSHDDGSPFDKFREHPIEAGTKLLLCPGTVQVYYGDETARSLDIPGTMGDATLRSLMNWDELAGDIERNGHRIADVLDHWQKIGRFRAWHPAVGAGVHEMISEDPYIFTRTYREGGFSDRVVVGLDMVPGKITLEVQDIYPDGTLLKDHYSGQELEVSGGRIRIDTSAGIILLAEK